MNWRYLLLALVQAVGCDSSYCFYERGSTDGKTIYRTDSLTVAKFNREWARGSK
jgi:hypothetical protein